MKRVRVGILAFQGAFAKHFAMLSRLNCNPQLVLTVDELFSCDGLIIPGGESTVMRKHIMLAELRDSLLSFAKCRPIFGTCAGLILMAKGQLLSLLDVSILRNAYGRQVDSFSEKIRVNFPTKAQEVEGIFIRAPRITEILSPQVEVIATHKNTPVFVKQGHFFGTSFHPELTNDPSIHQYFLDQLRYF